MSAVRILRTAARRWYLTLGGLLLTGTLLALVFAVFPLQYQATASVLLVPPVQKAGENPYLELSGMREVTEVLSRSMTSDTTKSQLEAKGFRGKYEVYRDAVASGPILVLYGQSDSRSVAVADRELILQLMDVRLAEIQGQLNIPGRSRITMKTINADEDPAIQWRTPLRLGIALAAAGSFGSLALAVGADSLLARRKSRAEVEDGESSFTEAPPNPPTEAGSSSKDQVPDWGWERPSDTRDLEDAWAADYTEESDRLRVSLPKG